MLSDGAVETADLVVVGVGVAPRVELAVAAGLEVDNGVVVDDQLRASAPGVFAAGDVASAWHPHFERRLRVEHWANALNQGITAGANAAGGSDAYDRLPYFFSDQYDLGMEYVGYADTDDEVVVRGSLADREFIAFWQRDGVGHGGDERQRVGRRRGPQGDHHEPAAIPADRLADPGIRSPTSCSRVDLGGPLHSAIWAATGRWQRCGRPEGLDVEAELDDVAVVDDVVLALEADLAELLGLRPAADVEQLVPADHLGADEAALEVGVDAPGALRRRRAVAERPRPRLLVAGREERAQAEQVVGAAHHAEQRALAEAEAFEHLGPLGRVGDRRRLGLELHAHADHFHVVAGVVELGGDLRLGGRDRVELVLADVDDGEHRPGGEQEVGREQRLLLGASSPAR